VSEYQYVVFQAVDRPLNDKQLEFAQRQSTRAEVTRWSLSVEYHYSSFRGDVDGLLRGGFDVYLQHSNYGTREIKLRLPHGLPFAESVWSKYVNGEQLNWARDDQGSGGILTLNPFHETGNIEDVWESQKSLDAVIGVRERLMSGDLRALYLLWLCAADDDYNDPAEMIEPPVPHGISEVAADGKEVLPFFGLDPLLLVAAGSGVAPAPNADSENRPIIQWMESLDVRRAKAELHRILVGDPATEKARLLAEIRDTQKPGGWPTSDRQRSLDDLFQQTAALRAEKSQQKARQAQATAKREAVKAERERVDRMQEMLKAPDKWLREAEQFVDARGTDNYKAAADILYDLREAVGGEEGERIARQHAAHLAMKYPTLNHLKSSLRKRGLLES